MLTSRVTIHPAFTIAPVPPRLFGSFVEHLGRCVYGGIFEPGHAEADVDGMRLDVLKLVRELGVSVLRYPGGNFVSGYHWEDGVGPRDQRPARLDLAWRSRESNQFGLNEFMAWCRLAGAEPMMAVNLGTRGITDACNLLEYTNHPGGTYYSGLRASHGVAEPHNIKLWCLGNEMDGPWQIGHKSADEYGRLAAATARAMRQVDPSIELVVCGSSGDQMPTFGSWESTVLDHAYDDVDYISLHAYYMQGDGDVATFLASGAAMDRFIEGVIATADHARAKRRSKKQLMLSFDEWNVWDMVRFAGNTNVDWTAAPRLLEQTYTTQDAVVFGSLLMSLLRHADRVTIACLAQLVNVIAPIRSEAGSAAWRQTIFYPFALTARHAMGNVLNVQHDGPTYPTGIGDVELTDVAATHDPESGDVVILAVSRSQEASINLDIDLRAFPELRVAEHLVMGGTDLDATNTESDPDRVVPEPGRDASVRDGHLEVTLPPVSWNLIRLVPVH